MTDVERTEYALRYSPPAPPTMVGQVQALRNDLASIQSLAKRERDMFGYPCQIVTRQAPDGPWTDVIE